MYERMLNKKQMPTELEFLDYCGTNQELFIDLNAFLMNELNLERLLRFPYGNDYG